MMMADRDHEKSPTLEGLRRQAESGDPAAQLALGLRHYEGVNGGRPDFMEALKWFARSAAQGNATAQFSLGNLYDKGRGVARDPAQAFAWYRKAAEQGFPAAQLNVGIMYEAGDCPAPGDLAEAARWYRRAAEQRLPMAQYNLGCLYAKGHGVPQDFEEAYAWLTVASFNGQPSAAAAQQAAAQHLDRASLDGAQARADRYVVDYGQRPGRLH